MANIKDIHGNPLSLSASDILIPSLGVSLADAIAQRLLPVPDNVTEQVEGLESKVAHAVGILSSVTVDVATDDTGTTHAEGAYHDGVLAIKLYNVKGDKGDTFTFEDLTDEQKAELKGEKMTFADLTEEDKNELRGAKGEGGKSAYECAVENGYSGTEAEWLDSLHVSNVTFSQIEESIIQRFNTTAVCWIDDDFSAKDVNNVEYVCNELGIKCTFAMIPDSMTEALLTRAKNLQKQGFQFANHPNHGAWYSSEEASAETRLETAIESRSYLEANGLFDASKIMVYPGFRSDDFVTKKWFDVGIAGNNKETNNTNYGVELDRYHLCRLFFQVSSSKTVNSIKQDIDAALNRGGLVILGTHGRLWGQAYDKRYPDTNEGLSEAEIQITPTLENLKDIISYANARCPIRTFNECWNERKFMFDFLKK